MTFERMGPMLVQRWEIPVPEAPDGVAVLGYDEGRGTSSSTTSTTAESRASTK